MIIRKYNVRIVFFLSSSPFFFCGRMVSIRRLHQQATWDLRLNMSSLDDGDDVFFDFLDQTNELLSFSLQDLLQHVSNLPSVLDQQFGCHYSCTSSGVQPVDHLLPQVFNGIAQHFHQFFVIHNIDMSSLQDLLQHIFDLVLVFVQEHKCDFSSTSMLLEPV